MSGRFDGNIGYWCPDKVLVAASLVYTTHREGILRITDSNNPEFLSIR